MADFLRDARHDPLLVLTNEKPKPPPQANDPQRVTAPDDPPWVAPFRPARIDDVVGQERAVENLRLAARAARARGEPVGHILLTGPAGLGKTTLARVLAAELGTRLHTAIGPAITQPHQLISLLTGLDRGDVLILDEIHALRACREEYLYTALEDGVLDAGVGSLRSVRQECSARVPSRASAWLGPNADRIPSDYERLDDHIVTGTLSARKKRNRSPRIRSKPPWGIAPGLGREMAEEILPAEEGERCDRTRRVVVLGLRHASACFSVRRR